MLRNHTPSTRSAEETADALNTALADLNAGTGQWTLSFVTTGAAVDVFVPNSWTHPTVQRSNRPESVAAWITTPRFPTIGQALDAALALLLAAAPTAIEVAA